MARAVRATRIAISPRFAISTRRTMRLRRSERDVAVLLRRSRLAFRAQHGERIDDPRSGLARFDHVVEVPHPGRDVRVREPVPIFLDEFSLPFRGFLRLLDLLLEDDLNGALGPHDGEFRGGPSEIEVPADMFRAHDVVGSAVGLARDHRDLRHGRLAEGEQELRAVPDDPAELLFRPGEEAGHVDEREEREVEAVAEPDEPRRLDRGVDVEGAREHLGLVPDNPDRMTLEAREAYDDVPRPLLVHLEPGVAVYDPRDHVAHVVRLVGFPRDDRREVRGHALAIVA